MAYRGRTQSGSLFPSLANTAAMAARVQSRAPDSVSATAAALSRPLILTTFSHPSDSFITSNRCRKYVLRFLGPIVLKCAARMNASAAFSSVNGASGVGDRVSGAITTQLHDSGFMSESKGPRYGDACNQKVLSVRAHSEKGAALDDSPLRSLPVIFSATPKRRCNLIRLAGGFPVTTRRPCQPFIPRDYHSPSKAQVNHVHRSVSKSAPVSEASSK